MNSKHFVIATTLVLAAVPCFAHDTWLLPRDPKVQESKTLTVDLTSGMAFPKLESGIKADRVAKGAWRTPSATGKLDRYEEDTASLVMHMTPRGEGTAVLYLTLKPKGIDLDASEVSEYLDEIGASESVRQDWASRGAEAKFHETYTKHAKSFVRVGGAGEDDTCRRPVGFAVELIPQRDPTALSVGDSLVVKATRGGDHELESFVVGIVCGKTGEPLMRRTNQNGMVAFPITDSGWWMVRATDLRRRSDGTYESDFTTMTFFVE